MKGRSLWIRNSWFWMQIPLTWHWYWAACRAAIREEKEIYQSPACIYKAGSIEHVPASVSSPGSATARRSRGTPPTRPAWMSRGRSTSNAASSVVWTDVAYVLRAGDVFIQIDEFSIKNHELCSHLRAGSAAAVESPGGPNVHWKAEWKFIIFNAKLIICNP